MATTPQALTPEQVAQIVAAGRGNTVNIGGTLYGGQWADTGSGETMQEGALQNIYGSSGQVGAGLPYYEYDPTGAYTRTGTQQKVGSFFGGLGEMFSDPVFLAALGGAGYAGLLGGGGAAIGNGAFLGEGIPTGVGAWDAAFTGAGGAFNPAFALGADGLVGTALPTATAAGTTAATAASSLTPAQIANLAKAGISVAGLIGAGNAVSNIGSTRTPATTTPPITYSGGGAGGYSPDYFSQVQSSYNQLMPTVPRDVASPLQNWYSTEFNPGASITGSLFGDMVGGTSTTTGLKPTTIPNTVPKPVTPPVVIPRTITPSTSPLYTSLTKTSSPTAVANAYADFISKSGGNTAANRKAATDYLTNLGLTQDQIGTSYNAYLSTLPASGNTYDALNATANLSNIAQAYSAFIANAGGDTEANRQRAITYLKDIGITEDAIGQAYTTYLSGLPTSTATTPAAATGNTYQGLSATSAPTSIAQAYETFVAGSGGDTPENQQVAINYLRDIGLSDEQIGQAYNTYTAGTTTGGGGGGMLSGGGQSMTGTAAEPSYTTLGAGSSPQSIAQAYADFVSASGGDTPENQRAAIDYLTNLGISQDTIGAAYGLFKGA
jgi:hypothetical protein